MKDEHSEFGQHPRENVAAAIAVGLCTLLIAVEMGFGMG